MPRYLVSWEIDIEADSPEEAARKAHEFVRKPDTLANVYQVIDSECSGEPVTIDLAELDQQS